MRLVGPPPLAHAAQVPELAQVLAGAGAVVRPADPDAFVSAVAHHRVVGHVLDAAREGRLELPDDALSQLETGHLTVSMQAQLLRRELGPAVAALTAACGAAPVLLKGPAVADRFYRDPRLRPFADLDLLVAPRRLEAGVAALEALGYERKRGPWQGYGERHGHEVALERAVGKRSVFVEVHWRISDDPAVMPLTRELLEAGGVELAVGGATAMAPSKPHQLVILAVHLLHEPAKRLVWINDVAVVAGALDEEQWEEAFATADRLGLGWVLHRALDHAGRQLGFSRARPASAGGPPAWGPLRAGEALGGWLGFQAGRVGIGWHRRDGYLRSAARARRRALLSRRVDGRAQGE